MKISRTTIQVTALAFSLAFSSLARSEDNGGIVLPDGFKATVFARELGEIRGLAVSPNGDVYGRVRNRGIVAMRDTDGDGVADEIKTVPESTGDGSGIGIRDGYLYFSTDNAFFRQPLKEGQLLPSEKPELIVDELGNLRSHSSKMFTFDEEGNVYIEVGAPQNALSEGDRQPGAKGLSDEDVAKFLSEWGGIWRFDPNKPGQTKATGHHFSTGHRHILSLAWHPVSNALFAVQNGRDMLNIVDSRFSVEYNSDRVSEEMHILREGSNLGWPYTYYDPIDNKRLMSPEYGGDGKLEPEEGRFQDPLIAFPAHWAPMQAVYYGGGMFPEQYHGGMFVAFHGSWNKYPEQQGYRVVFVPFGEDGMPTGEWDTFADGFIGKDSIPDSGSAKHRPMGVAVGPDGALYIGDDKGGHVWKVTYSGQ